MNSNGNGRMIPGPLVEATVNERVLSSWEVRVRDLASRVLSCRRVSFTRTGRRGFSLAEVLITILVTAVIMGAVITVLSLFFSNFQFVSSGVSAPPEGGNGPFHPGEAHPTRGARDARDLG